MEETIYVCECCMQIMANGDDTACMDYYGEQHAEHGKLIDGLWAWNEHTVETYYRAECESCGMKLKHGAMLTEFIRVA